MKDELSGYVALSLHQSPKNIEEEILKPFPAAILHGIFKTF